MASTFRLDSAASYHGRYLYLSCAQKKVTANNKSSITWTLISTGGTADYYYTGPTTVEIAGQQVYYKGAVSWESGIFPAAKGSVSGTIEVPHNSDGNLKITCSLTTQIYTGVLQTSSGEWTLDKIDRQAFLTGATDLTDEVGPAITFTKAGAGTIDLWLEPYPPGDHICARTDIPNTGSYTWILTDEEKAQLGAACSTENVCACRIGLRTNINGVSYTDYVDKALRIVNAAPSLTVTAQETNETVKNLVGSVDVLVRYRSDIRVTADYAAKKGASLKSFLVKNGYRTSSENPANFSSIESGSVEVSITDSRGNAANRRIDKIMIPYVKPSCSLDSARIDTSGTMEISVSGSFYNGSIGKTANALTIRFQYRENGTEQWIQGGKIPGTKANNKYTGSATISGLDDKKAYEVQASAEDVFETVSSNIRIARSLPVFGFGKDDFRFYVPTYDKDGDPICGAYARDFKPLCESSITPLLARVVTVAGAPTLQLRFSCKESIAKDAAIAQGPGLIPGISANQLVTDSTNTCKLEVRPTQIQTATAFPAGEYTFNHPLY